MALRPPPLGLDPEQALPQDAAALDWRDYDCELITPLYGGGVDPGEIDARMPVRVPAIRGQLRQWWRLLAQWKYHTPETELRAREFALWGGLGNTVQASRIWLRVEDVSNLDPQPWAEYHQNDKGRWKSLPDPQPWADVRYALFSAQGKAPGREDSKPPATLARPGLTWRLRLGWESGLDTETQQRVLEALRWWASFGGIGARTRRGLGAVRVQGLEPVSREEAQAAGCRLCFTGAPGADPFTAWRGAIGKLQTFRQGEGLGRNPRAPGSSRPGRSRWPEPAAIRALTGQHRIKSGGISFEPPPGMPPLFPREAFGLPIVFQFQGDKTDLRSDPSTVTLEARDEKGERIERMASPLILRPYLDAQGQWRGAALALPERADTSLHLTLVDGDKRALGEGRLTPAPAERAYLPPAMPTHGRDDDALEAFLFWLEDGAKSTNGMKATQ